MRKQILVIAAALVTAAPAMAGDSKGDFRVKGYGLQSCQSFLAAKANDAPLYLASRSWVNGYVTAYNQLSRGTFDIAGPVPLDGLMNWLQSYCQQNPQHPFGLAVTTLTAALEPQKLAANPSPGDAPNDPIAVRATVADIQKALKVKGFYAGTVDGLFGGGTQKALEAFQSAQGLTVTGQPDQATLVKLLQ